MKRTATVIVLFLALAPARATAAAAESAAVILQRVDENRVSGNKVILSEMTIHGRRFRRTVRARSWISGTEKSFSEYLDPPRERGTKMLKLGDQLWTYYPASDRVILIAGHMLRQPLMGSDLSYEDMLEDPTLRDSQEGTVSGEETLLGCPCWVLDLRALRGDAAYPSRRIWVDRERYAVMKEERFARSGRLLKTAVVESVRRFGDRWLPDRVRFKDALKEGEGTVFAVLEIQFDAAIPDAVFSKAALKK